MMLNPNYGLHGTAFVNDHLMRFPEASTGYRGPHGITGTVEMLLAGAPSISLRLMAR